MPDPTRPATVEELQERIERDGALLAPTVRRAFPATSFLGPDNHGHTLRRSFLPAEVRPRTEAQEVQLIVAGIRRDAMR